MRIIVDNDLRESNAICMELTPDLFEVSDDDLLYVLNTERGDHDRSRVEDCVRHRPKMTISIER